MTIKSMTGYATATESGEFGSLILELKTVNSRFLDINFKLAEECRSAEAVLRQNIMKSLQRGKVECRLIFIPNPLDQDQVQVSTDVMSKLAKIQRQIRTFFPDSERLRVGEIMRWPGIQDAFLLPEKLLSELMEDLSKKVLDALLQSRSQEGQKLKSFILERVSDIRATVKSLHELAPTITKQYQDKLTQRLKEAMAQEDHERVRQEVVIFGLKIDTAEELSRIQSHLDEIEHILEKGGAVGKRLDFLMQELNREANTLGSKMPAINFSRATVDIKLLIEQMREQIQNLE